MRVGVKKNAKGRNTSRRARTCCINAASSVNVSSIRSNSDLLVCASSSADRAAAVRLPPTRACAKIWFAAGPEESTAALISCSLTAGLTVRAPPVRRTRIKTYASLSGDSQPASGDSPIFICLEILSLTFSRWSLSTLCHLSTALPNAAFKFSQCPLRASSLPTRSDKFEIRERCELTSLESLAEREASSSERGSEGDCRERACLVCRTVIDSSKVRVPSLIRAT